MDVNELGTVSGLLSEHGPTIVILALFILLFLFVFGYFFKVMENQLNTNNKVLEKLLQKELDDNDKKQDTLADNNKKNSTDYDERNIVDIFLKLNKSLKSVCEDTLSDTNSNRTAIYVFHNGSHATHGLPFFKMSCISERVSKDSNVNICMGEHVAMPLPLFEPIVSSLYEKGEYRIIVDETDDPSDLIFVKNTKLKDCFFVPIYDSDDKIMGFIFNGYNELNPNIDITEMKKELAELAARAVPVIEFSKFQEYQAAQNKNKEE